MPTSRPAMAYSSAEFPDSDRLAGAWFGGGVSSISATLILNACVALVPPLSSVAFI
jgi:hypothetical protein